MYKHFLVGTAFIAIILFPDLGTCQTKEAPKIQNPNAASLNVFGETPVNLYTGTPNISIPIHNLSFGAIQVPIALSYHPAGVKPTVQPGWVGLGWNLECYGRITRQTRGIMIDELLNPEMQGGGLGDCDTYYPAPPGTYQSPHTSGAEKANVSNWDEPTRLRDYYTYGSPVYPTGGVSDMEADEFSFNFGNHSGKFYYSGPQLGWQVVSNESLKVELCDFSTGNYFLDKYEVYGRISQYHQFAIFRQLDEGWQTRLFRGFTITTEDGTKYLFGGPDAIEYQCPYGVPGLHNLFFSDNWLLKKIIDINGNEVNFEYKRSYPTVNLYFGRTDAIFSSHRLDGWVCPDGSVWSSGTVNTYVHAGVMQWPMYLTKISCLSESVEFQSSIDFDLQNMTPTHLRYTNNQLAAKDESNTPQGTNLFDLRLLASNPNLPDDLANVNNLQWEKLDWIIIKNSKQEVVKKYNFFYGSVPEPTKRLTLQSVTELSPNTVIKNESYQFFYDGVADLPNYFGNYTDHWGFFNNLSVHGKDLIQIMNDGSRETAPTNVTKGLLTSITYPTGGSIVFAWEPHDYSKVVSFNRNSLEDVTGTNYAGGSRIARVQNLSAEGAVIADKKYYYKRNYYSSALVSSLSSSGVLNGKPKYYMSIVGRANMANTATFNIEYASLNSLTAYSFSGQGSYIGYDEVVEVNSDGSYTKAFFTNYGTDFNGVSHFDIVPSYIGWKPDEDPYIPMNSLERERGLPISIQKFSSREILVQKKVTTYRNDEARFNNFIKTIHFNNSYSCAPGEPTLIFAAGIKVYNYVYYPIKTETTDYDAEGKNPITTTTSLSYNSYNLVSQSEEIDSRGRKKVTTFKYPFDFPSDQVLTSMANAHILSPVVETNLSIKNPTSTQLSLNRTNYFTPYPGIYVPLNVQFQKGTNAIQTLQQFNQYDQKGNVLELQKPNDLKEVYVWGYDGQLPIAKIIGSDYNTVYSYISSTPGPSQASRIILDNSNLAYTDSQVRTELQKIRAALANTKAQVTTYTYDPLKGMTSQTDATGKTIFYEFDDFGRLQVVKDNNGNILKTYDYKYKQ